MKIFVFYVIGWLLKNRFLNKDYIYQIIILKKLKNKLKFKNSLTNQHKIKTNMNKHTFRRSFQSNPRTTDLSNLASIEQTHPIPKFRLLP
jgi:hypothetical protein